MTARDEKFGISRQEAWGLVDRLTPTEREVARAFAMGEDRTAVADRLGISPRTLDSHLLSVRKKFGRVETHGIARIWFAAFEEQLMPFNPKTAPIEELLDDLGASHEDVMACTIALQSGSMLGQKRLKELADREVGNRNIIAVIRAEITRRLSR